MSQAALVLYSEIAYLVLHRRVKAIMRALVENQPAALFIDEVDCLMGVRGDHSNGSQKIIQSLLLYHMSRLDAEKHHVLILCATHLPWKIDSAFHPRLLQKFHVPPPNPLTKGLLCAHLLKDYPHEIEHGSMVRLGHRPSLINATADDIKAGIQDAADKKNLQIRDAVGFHSV